MLDADAMAESIFAGVKTYMDARLAPLVARLDELAAREYPAPADHGADLAELRTSIEATTAQFKAFADGEPERLSAVVAAIPAPRDGIDGKDGTPGADGKDADPEAVAALVEAAVSAIPAPKDGVDGKDGEAITLDDVSPMIEQAVEKAVGALPVAKDGQNGRDGIGVAGAMIDRSGALVLTLSDGKMCELGAVVGRDGEKGLDGKDGADGFNLEDFTADYDGDRTLTLRFARGDLKKEYAFDIPIAIYRGVFKDGEAYRKGDCVTWGGSAFIASRDTGDKPETSDAWKLSVKRGRDGKDGVMKPAPVTTPVRA